MYFKTVELGGYCELTKTNPTSQIHIGDGGVCLVMLRGYLQICLTMAFNSVLLLSGKTEHL